jgi:hypothetical protein
MHAVRWRLKDYAADLGGSREAFDLKMASELLEHMAWRGCPEGLSDQVSRSRRSSDGAASENVGAASTVI